MPQATADTATVLEVRDAIANKSMMIDNTVHRETANGMRRMDSSKVYIARIGEEMGDGAFAAVDIKEGEIVEFGIARRLPGLDGHRNPYVFTWSEDRSVWATCSGCAMFYNTSANNPNTKMHRYFEEDRFEIVALRDIKKDEQLTHTYRSLQWRQCFKGLAEAAP